MPLVVKSGVTMLLVRCFFHCLASTALDLRLNIEGVVIQCEASSKMIFVSLVFILFNSDKCMAPLAVSVVLSARLPSPLIVCAILSRCGLCRLLRMAVSGDIVVDCIV